MTSQPTLFDRPPSPAEERQKLLDEQSRLIAEYEGRLGDTPSTERKRDISVRIRAIRERLGELRAILDRLARSQDGPRRAAVAPAQVDGRAAAAGKERD